MIKSFKDADTEAVFLRQRTRRFPPDLQRRAQMKLFLLHTATQLEDLRVPPGNRLHALVADRSGQHSIRINDQWRICFTWREGDAYDGEIVDYH